MYSYIYHKKFYPQYIRFSRSKKVLIEDINNIRSRYKGTKEEVMLLESIYDNIEEGCLFGETVHIKSDKRIKELENSAIISEEGFEFCRHRYNPLLEDEWFWCYLPEDQEHSYHYWTYSKEVIVGHSRRLKNIKWRKEED